MKSDLHLISRFREQAKKLAHTTALRHKENGKWVDISWQTFQNQVDKL